MAANDKELTIVLRAKNLAKQELARLNKQLGGLFGSVKKYQDQIRTASKLMVGASILGAGLFVGAIATAGEFEQSLSNVSAVTKATAEDQKRLRDAALDMGSKSVFSASQAAQAQLFLGQAGQSTSEIIASLGGVMDLAAATSADLGFAAEVTAATLSQFGLDAGEASRVANVFAASASASQATIQKLSSAMRQAGPVANSLGMSLEETTGALNLLFNAGFKGEQAGTILRGVLTRLAKPAKEAADLIEELGIQVNDSSGKMLPFIDVIRQLEKANLTTAQSITIFGQEAGPGLLALLKTGSTALEDMTKKITDTNEASRQAKVRTDNLFGSITQLKSAIEGATITIGSEFIPSIKAITDTVTEWVRAFNDLDAPTQSLIANSALAGVGIVGLIGVMGLMVTAIVGIIGNMKKMGITITGVLGILGKFIAAITVFNLAWDVGKWLNGFKEVRKGMANLMEFFHTSILGIGLAWDAFILQISIAVKSLIDLLPQNRFFDALSASMGKWISAQNASIDEGIKGLNQVRENWKGVQAEIEKQGDILDETVEKTKILNAVMQDSHVQAYLAAKEQISSQEEIIANTKKQTKAIYELAEADLKVLEAEKAIVAEQLKSANERANALKQILDVESSLKSFLLQMDEKGSTPEEKDKSELIRQETSLARIIRQATNEKLGFLREIRFLEGDEKQAVLKRLQETSLIKQVEELRKVTLATKNLALSAKEGSIQESRSRQIAIDASEKLKTALTSLGIIRGQIDAQAIRSGKTIEDQYRTTIHQIDQLEAKFATLKEQIKDIKARIRITDQDKLLKDAQALRASLENKFAKPIIQEIILRQGGSIGPVARSRITTTRSSSGISIRGFASGLNRVPYDNFPAFLHRGERVQTASQVNQQNDQRPISITFGDIVLANGDPEEFIRGVIPLIREELQTLNDRTS